MRLMVYLESDQDQSYLREQQSYVQGFLYSILDELNVEIHENYDKYKFLTFSNIFPVGDMVEGEEKKFIISSPNDKLIGKLKQKIDEKRKLRFNNMLFNINNTSCFDLDLSEEGKMVTATPVIIRLSEELCKSYNIDNKGHDPYYWRVGDNIQAFINAVEINLKRKYEDYYNREIKNEEKPIFTNFNIKKQADIEIRYDDRKIKYPGTICELNYDWPVSSREQSRLINLAYSCGLGELNTSGCGFVNEVIENA